VVGLGIFDFEEDPMYAPGLIWPHEIGIWNDGELVYSTTVPPGTEDTVFLDDFRYIETDSFWLSEGETYVIGTTEFGDPFIGNSSSASITTLDSIIYGRTLMSPSDSGFSLPTLDRDYYFCGPNFLVIPEPTTLALLGSGIILIRQKHNKKKTR
jgi:hypothetical protein